MQNDMIFKNAKSDKHAVISSLKLSLLGWINITKWLFSEEQLEKILMGEMDAGKIDIITFSDLMALTVIVQDGTGFIIGLCCKILQFTT